MGINVVRRGPPSRLLTPAEAAERLHVKPKTLANWRVSKRAFGPTVTKIGGRPLYDLTDIEQFIASSKVGGKR